MAAQQHADTLKTKSHHQNSVFSSWRLNYDAFQLQRCSIQLPGPVSGADQSADALDYLHTHVSVMRNRLIQTDAGLYLFLKDLNNDDVQLHELQGLPSAEAEQLQLRLVARSASNGMNSHAAWMLVVHLASTLLRICVVKPG